MSFLLDTHVLLWWLHEPDRLSERAQTVMRNEGNRLLWSAASTWELAIKISLGRLELPEPLGQYLPARLSRQQIEALPVGDQHACEISALPHHHRDPFDRMLVAQARVEKVPLISADSHLKAYDVEILW